MRRLETITAALSTITGTLGWLYALFGPVYVNQLGERASVAQMSLNPMSITFFAVMLLSIAGVGAGAYFHTRPRNPRAPTILRASTVVLLAGRF